MRAGVFLSKTLNRNMAYLVYLPDGYQSGQLNYPVLYLLHGAGGDEHAWAAPVTLKKRRTA